MVDFTMQFPAGFLWGTATSAHQVEGGNTNNNWSAWEKNAGHVFQGQKSGQACDWWNGRYTEDFDRAVAMHNNAHRLSVEWSRIEPEPGRFDDAALEHYVRVIDALRERNLEPMVTLHHFTNPLWLQDKGGWLNPDAVQHFEGFVRRVVEALGDRVTLWCTINEPMVFVQAGYIMGRFPPGKHSMGAARRVTVHLLKAHAAAYHAIKDIQPGAQVGLAKAMISLKTRTPGLIHKPARNISRHFFNRAFIEGLTTGVLRLAGGKTAIPEARDTLDWLGLNYYYRFQAGLNPLIPHRLFVDVTRPREGLLGPESVGECWPEGLAEHIKWLSRHVGCPLYITENGMPDADDTYRPLHMIRSVHSLWQAINMNASVKGYFYWTLVDNFEWAEGYDPRFRFGLYGCDHETQERSKRQSAALYGEICEANALTGDMARRYVPDHADALFPGVDVLAEVRLPER
ncbi:MAG: glycoside hydrolase family 1 protein [Anaerolineae bacterium]|nr:glycoside hydrolase family 1 protein [Anaerolineae bacterium]